MELGAEAKQHFHESARAACTKGDTTHTHNHTMSFTRNSIRRRQNPQLKFTRNPLKCVVLAGARKMWKHAPNKRFFLFNKHFIALSHRLAVHECFHFSSLWKNRSITEWHIYLNRNSLTQYRISVMDFLKTASGKHWTKLNWTELYNTRTVTRNSISHSYAAAIHYCYYYIMVIYISLTTKPLWCG